MIAQPILYGAEIGLFIGGAGVSIGVIVATIAPQWRRICRLALGNIEPSISTSAVRMPAEAISL